MNKFNEAPKFDDTEDRVAEFFDRGGSVTKCHTTVATVTQHQRRDTLQARLARKGK